MAQQPTSNTKTTAPITRIIRWEWFNPSQISGDKLLLLTLKNQMLRGNQEGIEGG